MDDDDLVSKRGPILQKDLGPLSVKELRDYILSLETEIARARGAISAKTDVRAGAESLFRK